MLSPRELNHPEKKSNISPLLPQGQWNGWQHIDCHENPFYDTTSLDWVFQLRNGSAPQSVYNSSQMIWCGEPWHPMATHCISIMSVCSSCIWYYNWTHRPAQFHECLSYSPLYLSTPCCELSWSSAGARNSTSVIHVCGWHCPCGLHRRHMTSTCLVCCSRKEAVGQEGSLNLCQQQQMKTDNICISSFAHAYCIRSVLA